LLQARSIELMKGLTQAALQSALPVDVDVTIDAASAAAQSAEMDTASKG